MILKIVAPTIDLSGNNVLRIRTLGVWMSCVTYIKKVYGAIDIICSVMECRRGAPDGVSAIFWVARNARYSCAINNTTTRTHIK